MIVLVCNVGSTSLKFKLFDMPSPVILCEGKVERVGRQDAIYSYQNQSRGYSKRQDKLSVPAYADGIRLFLADLLDPQHGALSDLEELAAIGFKTVLAKGYYGVHELTEEVIQAMEAYISVAPAHNPPYIEAIRVFREILPEVKMIGCFETAFHTTIPMERRIYALPYAWYEKYGIQKLGFHGASHNYIASCVGKIVRAKGAGTEPVRLISCHLGGSGSICAILDGKSVDTSFGFSLQTGIPHANRAGDIDAYIFPYLVSEGMSLDEITRGIDKEGGLLGISGVSNDLRDIEEAAAAGNERARLAVHHFTESIIRYIGAFYAELGGLDYLVFTGGIGENSVAVREEVCSRLACLGIAFDPTANRAFGTALPEENTDPVRTALSACQAKVISAPASRVTCLVIPANEEVGIAQTIYTQAGTSE